MQTSSTTRRPRQRGHRRLVAKTGARRDPRIGVRITRIARRTLKAFGEDNISRLGAALAYYTTVAVAPLLVLAIILAGAVFSEDAARSQVVGEIESLIGPQAAAALNDIHSPLASKSGTAATAIGFVTMIFGALGVFQHLQDALNAIWRTRPRPGVEGFWNLVRRRVFSVATVLMSGFILMASLIASALLNFLAASALSSYGLPAGVMESINTAFSLFAATLLFALIFKLLPDIKIRWRDVWLGAFVTAVLFTAGKTLLGFYISKANMTSTYGAAGSLIALLVWCYYAAQIVFLGAEATRITALSRGGRDFSALEEPQQKSTCTLEHHAIERPES